MNTNIENYDQFDIEAEKRRVEAEFEREQRMQNGGSGKMRNPMKHLQPKKKKRR